MSYALAPRDMRVHGPREARAASRSQGPPGQPLATAPADLTPATLTVTPACDRVYCYSVSESSAWTTTDLLRILRLIVRSPHHEAASPSEMLPSGQGRRGPYVNETVCGDGGFSSPALG